MPSARAARAARSSLSQSVSSRLSLAIIAGEFPPGTRISEPALSSRLGVSRAPIREALVELQLRGLVTFDATGHTRIPVFTAEDIDEIYNVRLMIDPFAAALAARHAGVDELAALEANLVATKSAKTLADVSRLDAEFHDLIMRAAGNRRLLSCWSMLRDQIALWLAQMQRRRDAMKSSTRKDTVDAHRRLLAAIRSGDPKKASREATRHVTGWIELMPAVTADGAPGT
jgi:DNA-binding GntR family transcriptional regulator